MIGWVEHSGRLDFSTNTIRPLGNNYLTGVTTRQAWRSMGYGAFQSINAAEMERKAKEKYFPEVLGENQEQKSNTYVLQLECHRDIKNTKAQSSDALKNSKNGERYERIASNLPPKENGETSVKKVAEHTTKKATTPKVLKTGPQTKSPKPNARTNALNSTRKAGPSKHSAVR